MLQVLFIQLAYALVTGKGLHGHGTGVVIEYPTYIFGGKTCLLTLMLFIRIQKPVNI